MRQYIKVQSKCDIIMTRSYILGFVKQLVMIGAGVKEDELQVTLILLFTIITILVFILVFTIISILVFTNITILIIKNVLDHSNTIAISPITNMYTEHPQLPDHSARRPQLEGCSLHAHTGPPLSPLVIIVISVLIKSSSISVQTLSSSSNAHQWKLCHFSAK